MKEISLVEYRQLMRLKKRASWIRFWAIFAGCVIGWVIGILSFCGCLMIYNALKP